jgi:hypothetical protein
MPKISFKISTKPDLEAVGKAFRKSRVGDIDKKMEALSIVIHRHILEEAPERSGNLKKSIQRKRRGQFVYEIFVDRRMRGGKYERAIRLGMPASKINPILPKKRRALFWPGARHPVKAVYNHPGIKANPYWERGLDKSESDINRAEQVIGSDIAQELTVKLL